MNLSYDAMIFADEVHKTQLRRYTGCPYRVHLAEVAGIVASVAKDFTDVLVEEAIAVSWLHDSVEDQNVTYDCLQYRFGKVVADGVMLLSDLEEGNRAQRKAAARERLAAAPGWIQSIKCADLISNTASIAKHDPKFAVVYFKEKEELLSVLTKADARLHNLASYQVKSVW